LDRVLAETERRQRELRTKLEGEQCLAVIEEVLPDGMKGQARRLVKRALLTFASRPYLKECSNEDFLRCVIRAAEMGLAIDDRLCHVVRFGGKQTSWQAMPDYKGLIAVAKRSGQIKDCYADVVCANDTFRAYRDGATSHLIHELPPRFGHRGQVIGAYAIVKLPDGDWRYELMSRAELDNIQRRAPAKNGPWATDPDEMRKKTVLRRLLKTYCDDPAFVRAQEIDDECTDAAPPLTPRPPLVPRITNSNGDPEDFPPTASELDVPSDELIDDATRQVQDEAAEAEARNQYDSLSERIGHADTMAKLQEVLTDIEKAQCVGILRQQQLRDLAQKRHKEITGHDGHVKTKK
jgi:recombination protein RecT